MPGFFDSLREGFSHATTRWYDALQSASEESVIDQCSFLELSTTAKLVEADMLVFGYTEEHTTGGQFSPQKHKEAAVSVNEIRETLVAQTGYLAGVHPQSPLQRTAPIFNPGQIRRAATELAQLTHPIKIKTPTLLVGDTVELQPPNAGVQKGLDLLYKALTKQLSSNCSHRHVARLKLTGFTDNFDGQMRLFFDLFLSSHFDWTPCRWLQSRCIIENSLNSTETPGCHFIEEAEHNKLSISLRIGKDPMLSLLRGQGDLWSNPSHPTVSLGYLIDEGYFDKSFRVSDRRNRYFLPSERAKLCCTLARSLLHLSGNGWAAVAWHIDAVFFLKDASTGRLIDKEKPYLSWDVRNGTMAVGADADVLAPNGTLPPGNSTLINFARLLMEIYGHQRIVFDQSVEDLQSVLFGCIHEINDSNVREAIVACLGSRGNEAVKDQSDPTRLQTFIFQQVLQRLEASRQSYREPQLEELRPQQPLSNDKTTHGQSTLPDQSPYDGKEYNTAKDHEAAQNAATFCQLMGKYTDRYIKRSSTYNPQTLPPHLRRKTRIAVIDSGAKKTDIRIKGATKADRIHGRNFLSGRPEEWNDSNGHGTHIACLLLDMAPEAELYIAKVSEGWYVEKDQLTSIAQAINWAVQVWDVDIITMSLVLAEKHDAVEAELEQAMHPTYEGGRSRIVFAAAGNRGGNTSLGWPARMEGVIAIHATNGVGDAASFNPTASPESFATLGCDIERMWWVKQGEKPYKSVYLSGTSFATPIAAAIAANVLEYVRWKLRPTSRQNGLLHSPRYMREIFAKMMQRRFGYNYVQPWMLWERGWENAARQNIPVDEVLRDIIRG